MKNRRFGLVFPALLLFGFSWPDSYPPPAQIVMPAGAEPAIPAKTGPREFLAMSDPDVDAHILGDVFPPDDNVEWRYTGLHPRFRLDVRDQSRLVFYLRFFNPGDALRERGPVTVTVNINGQKATSQRFAYEADQEMRYRLIPGILTQPGPVEITLDISPAWHDYGLMIHSIGFERAAQ